MPISNRIIYFAQVESSNLQILDLQNSREDARHQRKRPLKISSLAELQATVCILMASPTISDCSHQGHLNDLSHHTINSMIQERVIYGHLAVYYQLPRHGLYLVVPAYDNIAIFG